MSQIGKNHKKARTKISTEIKQTHFGYFPNFSPILKNKSKFKRMFYLYLNLFILSFAKGVYPEENENASLWI